MFRSSQVLLSQSIATLLHPRVPLSAPEARKLFNVLTTSFRSHLDAEHGQAVSEPGSEADSAGPATSKSAIQKRTRAQPLHRRDNHVDRHLQSILSNPLFNSGHIRPTGVPSPMAMFERAVAHGMMDIDKAAYCLRHEKEYIISSNPAKSRDGMKQSGAGLKVLRWLASSEAIDHGGHHLLFNPHFSTIFMQFLIAEGLRDAAWTLTTKALELLTVPLPSSKITERRTKMRTLLDNLIRAEISYGDVSLDSAYLCAEKAWSYMEGMPLDLRTRRLLLVPALNSLIGQTRESYGIRLPPSEERFESFLSLVTIVQGDRSFRFASAHLHLLHPSRPSAELALRTLRRWPRMVLQSNPIIKAPLVRRQAIGLGLNTTKFLLDNDRYSEADWVMQFLRSNFSEDLGEHQHQALNDQVAEASSLEMLSTIALA
ncbi:uncharacterized protein BP5553_02207 [Venustampulla echinocandica]|uniref:Uncharacterized protein n=1 Tax=Venustampulla echinocandica TaxID=2656787 RepID=A0A370U376_9HELO|nr:uncharacterized protein BP5553_02207 [Venustampulla echinocandica]RDL42228.1 hypothetical protein BP5553_02207 [Venustampulla echinocandica]